MSRVAPPSIVRFEVLLMRLEPPSTKVPPSSSIVPLPAFSPVASIVTLSTSERNRLPLPVVVAFSVVALNVSDFANVPTPLAPAASDRLVAVISPLPPMPPVDVRVAEAAMLAELIVISSASEIFTFPAELKVRLPKLYASPRLTLSPVKLALFATVTSAEPPSVIAPVTLIVNAATLAVPLKLTVSVPVPPLLVIFNVAAAAKSGSESTVNVSLNAPPLPWIVNDPVGLVNVVVSNEPLPLRICDIPLAAMPSSSRITSLLLAGSSKIRCATLPTFSSTGSSSL